MKAERYRLVLTHDLIDDGKEIRVEDPKLCQIVNFEDTIREVDDYENRVLDELFNRFRIELKLQKNKEKNHD